MEKVHREGSKHGNADALSRKPEKVSTEMHDDDDINSDHEFCQAVIARSGFDWKAAQFDDCDILVHVRQVSELKSSVKSRPAIL